MNIRGVLTLLLLITLQTKGQHTHLDEVLAHEKTVQSWTADASFSQASTNFKVHYYQCEWEIDPAILYIKGKVSPHFFITASTTSLVFDLSHALRVDSVCMRNVRLNFSQSDDETLFIHLPANYSQGEEDSLSIFYQGAPMGGGLGSFQQTYHNNVPVVWTLSEPYGARDWWPCRNGLDDKVDSIDIYVKHPSIYKASSNGLLQGEIKDGSSVITHYKHRYPVASYLIAFAVTNYSVFTDHVQLGNISLAVISYVYPEDSAFFHNNITPTLNAMQLYHTRFTAYPFIKERYGQTQFSFGGGMEHQSNSFVVSPGENLVAHELAHQWFGDKVTCKSWEDIWLNEGFATFCADFLYCENFNIQEYNANVLNDLNYIVSQPNGSVKVNDTLSVGRIFDSRLSYKKGAFLLRMLRWTLSDSVFFKAINNYLTDATLQYNFASTADLQHHLEIASGTNLAYFFKQWYEGEGYPSFTVEWGQNQANQAKIILSQATSDVSVPFFRVPLSITFKNASQEKTIVIEHTINNQVVVADIGFAADTILIDKDMQLISKNNKAIHTPLIESIFPYTITVYPNPFIDKITLGVSVISDKKMSVELFDVAGRKILNNIVPIKTGNQTYSFTMPVYVSAGIYFLRVNLDGLISTYTLLKK